MCTANCKHSSIVYSYTASEWRRWGRTAPGDTIQGVTPWWKSK